MIATGKHIVTENCDYEIKKTWTPDFTHHPSRMLEAESHKQIWKKNAGRVGNFSLISFCVLAGVMSSMAHTGTGGIIHKSGPPTIHHS